MITLHGTEGQHATDLKARGLFKDITETGHIIIVPISHTKACVMQLLQGGVPNNRIVNLSGVMSTSPREVHNLHFLFGPGTKNNLTVATTENISIPGRFLLDNAEKCGMRIVHIDQEEHDKKMAIVQWLSHILLILVWWEQQPEVQKSLLVPWITPIGTIQEMIFQNPFARPVIIDFFDRVKQQNGDVFRSLETIIQNQLTQKDIDNLGTPNFRRILDFIKLDTKIRIPEERVLLIQSLIHEQKISSIEEEVRAIRT